MANVSVNGQTRGGRFANDFWLCTTLMFLVEFGCAVLGAPSPRLLEMAVCQDYYRKHGDSSTEEDCKIQEIQAQLGFMLTVLSTCSILAATLMQVPMGFIADKRGRRLALVLNITSTLLYWGWIPFIAIFSQLPIWVLYVAPIFVLIGGGPWASGALVFAAINRKITPSQRTLAFSIMEALSGIADLVGPALGALTMEGHIWLPFLLATFSFALMFVPTWLLEDETPSSTELNNTCSETEVSQHTNNSEGQPLLPGIGNGIYGRGSERTFVNSTATIYCIAFGSFFLVSLARDSNNFLIPWISWRFNEPMARAGLIFSLRAVVSSIVFFVLLPLASSFLSRIRGFGPLARDLLISASSTMLLCAGSIIVATSPGLSILILGFCIMTLGSGVTVSLRAFLASRIDRSLSGRLFTAISTTSTIGGLVGMPLMGTLYSLNISNKASNISLPFMVAAVAYFVVSCVIGSLQLNM